MSRTGAIRSTFADFCLATALFLLAAGFLAAQQPADPPPTAPPPAKPKKVYTDDDIQQLANGGAAAAKPARPTSQSAKDPNADLARSMRDKLEKLAAQIKDADKQIDELKRFQAGELSGDAGRQLHKGYNTTPIPEQIDKLEEKKR